MKSNYFKFVAIVFPIFAFCFGAPKTLDRYMNARNSLLLENLEAFSQSQTEPGNYRRPCNTDLKKGKGIWRCGNPCVWESNRTNRTNKPEDQGECY